jgi:hypothetical protein
MSNDETTVNNELERASKKVVVAKVKVLSWHFSGGTPD